MFLNGNKILEEREMTHNDRLIIGTNSIFVVKYQAKRDEASGLQAKDEQIDWEFAQTELIDVMDEEKKIKIAESEQQRAKEGELEKW